MTIYTFSTRPELGLSPMGDNSKNPLLICPPWWTNLIQGVPDSSPWGEVSQIPHVSAHAIHFPIASRVVQTHAANLMALAIWRYGIIFNRKATR